ncbi:MAG TPA: PIG-L deacetylase family protein [Candidatus Limnocylindrales bacterium]|nr:PIG-L deacetylase family protein [Candidatus Limnocylindrales bacterium]
MQRYDSGYVPRSAMAIFAHPDDAGFTVAGTIARWTKAGCEATLVVLTSGNAGTHDRRYTRETLARTREEEEMAAARVLGVKNVVFLRHDDCALQPTLEVRRELVREIRRFRPEVVICGDPQAWFYNDTYINHPDHRAAGVAALEAVFPAAEMELLWPEEGLPHKVQAVYVSSTHSPNTWIDITDTIGTKIEALKAHASQLEGWDPSGRIRDWGRSEAGKARDRTTSAGSANPDRSRPPDYAEGFRVIRLRERERPPES